MILLFAGAAHAEPFQDPRTSCSVGASRPIAGTAGFSNALQALRTNAATYSASSFVERYALRSIAMQNRGDRSVGIALLDGNFMLGATRVPVYQTDAVDSDCPAEWLLGTRPVDLYAYDGGGAFRYGRVGLFYGASVTFGYPAELTYLRAYQTVASVALSPLLLGFAPLGSWQTQSGASAYAQDFVAGAIVDAGVGDLRGGYTQSRGWYLSANDHWVGLFGSVVLRDGLHLVGQFRGGAERVHLPGQAGEKAGRPSAYARILPLTEPLTGSDGQTRQVDLTTGHLEQEGIGGIVDLRGAYAFRPVLGVHEASIAIHDPHYYDAEDAVAAESPKHWYAEAGFVTLPPLYYYGVEGGTKVHLRADYVWTPTDDAGDGLRISFGLRFNDPEETALYPFAVDAVGGHFQIQGGL